MKPKKPIRKYGLLRHGLRRVGYVTHWAALVPVLTAITCLTLVATIGTPICFLLFLGSVFSPPGPNVALPLYYLLTSVALGGISYIGWQAIANYFQDSPQGGLLTPKPPVENPLLPDRNLLVRASGQDQTTQRQELLRGAQYQEETRPEELLRVVE